MRKKKTEQEVLEKKNEEEIKQDIQSSKEKIKEVVKVEKPKARPLCKVKAKEDVELRQYPCLDHKFIQGKMDKRKVYNVISEITSAPIKMYLLDNGYYVVADGKLLKF